MGRIHVPEALFESSRSAGHPLREPEEILGPQEEPAPRPLRPRQGQPLGESPDGRERLVPSMQLPTAIIPAAGHGLEERRLARAVLADQERDGRRAFDGGQRPDRRHIERERLRWSRRPSQRMLAGSRPGSSGVVDTKVVMSARSGRCRSHEHQEQGRRREAQRDHASPRSESSMTTTPASFSAGRSQDGIRAMLHHSRRSSASAENLSEDGNRDATPSGMNPPSRPARRHLTGRRGPPDRASASSEPLEALDRQRRTRSPRRPRPPADRA